MASHGLRRANDPPLLILVSLAAGPKHGHALAKDIEDFAGVRLGPGALYGAITRLVERGLIEPLGGDDRRRPYRITPRGWPGSDWTRHEARKPAPLVPLGVAGTVRRGTAGADPGHPGRGAADVAAAARRGQGRPARTGPPGGAGRNHGSQACIQHVAAGRGDWADPRRPALEPQGITAAVEGMAGGGGP